MTIQSFAVPRVETDRRWDPNYHWMNRAVSAHLSGSLFPLVRIADVERLLQYGCSRRADYDASGLPIVRMANIQNDGWRLEDVKFVHLPPGESEVWRLEVGDLVFNRTNSKELVGKCEVFDRPETWVFASYLMRLRVDTDRVLPPFLRDVLNGIAGRCQIDRDSRQIAGMSNINAEELRGIRFPSPDLKVQHRLIALMNEARASRRNQLEAATSLLKGLDEYVLTEVDLHVPPTSDSKVWASRRAHGSNLRLDAHFHQPRYLRLDALLRNSGAVPLRELCVLSRARIDPRQGPGEEFDYIEISGVDATTGEASAVATRRSEAPSRARMCVRAGDIIVSLTRPALGSIALIDDSLNGRVASTGFAVLTEIDEALVLPEYLWAFLRTPASRLQMQQRSTGGNYPAISEEELKAMLVVVPSREVQARIATEVGRRRSRALRLRADAHSRWKEAQATFDVALLGQAALQRAVAVRGVRQETRT